MPIYQEHRSALIRDIDTLNRTLTLAELTHKILHFKFIEVHSVTGTSAAICIDDVLGAVVPTITVNTFC